MHSGPCADIVDRVRDLEAALEAIRARARQQIEWSWAEEINAMVTEALGR